MAMADRLATALTSLAENLTYMDQGETAASETFRTLNFE
jgi:hypothetical protein